MSVPTWDTAFHQVSPSVWAYVQGGGPGRSNFQMSNAAFVVGDNKVLVIDTLQGPIPALTLRDKIRAVTDKPVRHVVNTHGHPDHTSGNQYFLPTTIIAHELAARLMRQVGIPGGSAVWKPTPGVAKGGEERLLVMPDMLVPDGVVELYDGGLEIELHCGSYAHSDGDIAVWLPQQKILIGGDLAFFYVPPSILSGTSEGFLRQLDWIDLLGAQVIIPGHGPIGGPKEVALERRYMTMLRAGIRKGFDAGLGPIDAAAAVDLGEFADWPDAEDRLLRNGLRIHAEFAGTPHRPITFDQAVAAGKAFDEKRRARKAAAGGAK